MQDSRIGTQTIIVDQGWFILPFRPVLRNASIVLWCLWNQLILYEGNRRRIISWLKKSFPKKLIRSPQFFTYFFFLVLLLLEKKGKREEEYLMSASCGVCMPCIVLMKGANIHATGGGAYASGHVCIPLPLHVGTLDEVDMSFLPVPHSQTS